MNRISYHVFDDKIKSRSDSQGIHLPAVMNANHSSLEIDAHLLESFAETTGHTRIELQSSAVVQLILFRLKTATPICLLEK
jgi:hypothetical protein